MEIIFVTLYYAIQAFMFALFIYVILSWVLNPYHPARQAMARIFEPLLQPIRNLLPQTGPFDFSVLVLFLLLELLGVLLRQMAQL